MRVVIDTDVIVAGMRSPGGASAEVLRRVLTGRIKLVASVATIIEYEAVATRPQHLAAAGIGVVEVLTVIDALAATAVQVQPHYRYRPLLRDANDEMILEAAINGAAGVIVTFNRRDFKAVPDSFGIEIMLPADLLRIL